MSTTHGRLSAQAARRLQAGELILRGFENEDIMKITESSHSSVKRWRAKVEQTGLSGLARQGQSGRYSKLTDMQREELKTIILTGVKAAGYHTDRWTSRIVADLIRKKWNVNYSTRHIRYLLCSLNLSYQRPEVKSTKHSQKAVDHWKKHVWPRIKKRRTSSV